jgi:GNAT superfamily N-acetyltransferase
MMLKIRNLRRLDAEVISEYKYFREHNIPEIQDLNVLPTYRRRGIATALMDEAETIAKEHGPIVGIGVGLHPGYNAAQRMYVLRGYVPDGRGVTWRDNYIKEGQELMADDDLVLHLTKH